MYVFSNVPGHRPHVPSEVPLSPRRQSALLQAKTATARVQRKALRRTSDLSGTPTTQRR